ncbi:MULTISPECIES: hypothetical protein [unclassified Pseudoalteromonas]|uniref:hypothetical protein n=1 Tax=unclassified Pseudoalteromonas TaxID=194690 RepID=UPI000CF631BD|nr:MULTISPECIES: hypothetical protein [unclassified Pseudoalteromonas]
MKSVFKYLGIGVLLGLGISIVDEAHYHLSKKDRLNDFEDAMEKAQQLRESMTISSDELFLSDIPDMYYDPSHDLYFSIQSYKDMGDVIEISGVISNKGSSTWKTVEVDFEAYTDEKKLIANCSAWTGQLVPLSTDGVVVRCDKVQEFISQPISEVTMQIRWNFHGERVISHNKPLKRDL